MFMHVDMDAFYASIEQLDNPDLQGKPVIVGNPTRRGVVTTASYEARVFGVRSAMPMFKARALCPDAIVVPGRMRRYREVSGQVMAVLADVSPVVEQVSIDEAYVDIAGTGRIHGKPVDVARQIKSAIRTRLHLTCSIGIAPLKFLSKIASDLEKPDGLTVIQPEEMMAVITALPVQEVPGVGAATLDILNRHQIRTLGDVRRLPTQKLTAMLGKFGRRLAELSNGIDRSQVQIHRPTRSVSAERTLSENTTDKSFLRKCLLNHAERVGRELREEGLAAKTVTIKIKYEDFRQITRNATLPKATQSSAEIFQMAARLLEDETLVKPVRLIGVGLSGLIPDTLPVQQDLFDTEIREKRRRWQRIDSTVDGIAKKFGRHAVFKAGMTDEP